MLAIDHCLHLFQISLGLSIEEQGGVHRWQRTHQAFSQWGPTIQRIRRERFHQNALGDRDIVGLDIAESLANIAI